ncbi:MAG: hypothetical protein FWD76_04620 [Firmicutes bacterium]|nr:hypothetical protein [Bacillota bacterium]
MAIKFDKKLVIMQGLHDEAKATVAMEKGEYGFSCHISGILQDLDKGQYACALKTSEGVQVFLLGMNGRINAKFEILESMGTADTVHCILFLRYKNFDKPYLYGTNGTVKLWEGNMMDGIKREVTRSVAVASLDESTSTPVRVSEQSVPQDRGSTDTALESNPRAREAYTRPTPSFDKDFESVLQLLDTPAYDDTQIASVNFYDLYKDGQFENGMIGEPISQEKAEAHSTHPSTGSVQAQSIPQVPFGDIQFGLVQNPPLQPLEPSAPKGVSPQQAFASSVAYDATVMDKVSGAEFATAKTTVDTSQPSTQSYPTQTVGMGQFEAMQRCHKNTRVEMPRSFGERPSAPTSWNAHSERGSGAFVASAPLPPIVDIPSLQPNNSFVTQSAQKNAPLSFYDRLSVQIEKLFETYQRETELEKLLPDTKWCKIDFDNNGRYYCIGLVGKKPDYICYAVPSPYTPLPPPELDGYCQWLPLQPMHPKGKGYWVLYQDAYSGESVGI